MRCLGGKQQHKYDDGVERRDATDGGSFNKLEDQVASKDESACVIDSRDMRQIPLWSKPDGGLLSQRRCRVQKQHLCFPAVEE